MKTCKVKPPASACCSCIDIAESYNHTPDCKNCSYNTTRYEIVQIGSNFWGGYAIIQNEGKLEKISLDRVYDVQEKE